MTEHNTEYKLPSYPKVLAIGHRLIANLFNGPVVVQEKVDGSQFTFGKKDGQLFCRSKGKQLILDAPEKMFALAVQSVRERAPLLKGGWVYRAEYLNKPKHNTLEYDRAPAGHLVLFDAHPDDQGHGFLTPRDLECEARSLNLEPVPVLYEGLVSSPDELLRLLETPSALGGPKVEGVVVKNYHQFTADGHYCVGKLVSEAFKEKHQGEWRKANPNRKDVVATLIAELRNENRWQKAVQHLREAGNLDESPKDIGNLIKEVQRDIRTEEEEHIKDILFRYFWPTISRGVIAGLPEWYKEQVMVHAFPPSTESNE